MTTLDRQTAYTGHQGGCGALRFDHRRLEAYLAANAKGFRPAQREAVHAAASRIRPTCSKRRRANTCCAASRPASCSPRRMRSTASSRRSARFIAQGFPVAEPVVYCADESVTGTAFYVMSYSRRPRDLGAGHARLGSQRAHRGVRRDERDARAAALLSIRPRSASPTTAAARTTSRARSTAGRSSIAPARPRRSTRWSA